MEKNLYYNPSNDKKDIHSDLFSNISDEIENLIFWLRKEVYKAKSEGVIIAFSGGIDSAVLLALAKKTFPHSTNAIWIDIFSSSDAKKRAINFSKKLEVNFKEVNLNNTFNNVFEDIELKEAKNLTKSNLKARMRMLTVYAYANEKNYIVLGSSNAVERYLGYFTKWGDECADLYPLIKYNKSQIREIAKFLDVDKEIIDAIPSADLFEGQNDEKEFGFTYKQIDDYLDGKKIDNNVVEKIKLMSKNSEHKRDKLKYFK